MFICSMVLQCAGTLKTRLVSAFFRKTNTCTYYDLNCSVYVGFSELIILKKRLNFWG